VKSSNHLIVIGGGAAGFFCAVNAARLHPSLKVTILEKSSKVLQKVKVSGGGRCNVTHSCFEISQMVKRYPRGERFLKKAFHHFFTTDTIEWFSKRGVNLVAEADGRMFPHTNDSQTIIDCLLAEANKYNVEVKLHSGVVKIERKDNLWEVYTNTVSVAGVFQGAPSYRASMMCVTCGGFPKVEQFNWLTSATGHTVSSPVPSLFTFNLPQHPIRELMGVAVANAQVKLAGSKLQTDGPLLITHWGLSGPAVLRMSAFAARELAEKKYQYMVIINWLPEFNENSLREKILQHRQLKGTQKLLNTDWITLPQRLWQFLLVQSAADLEQRWADFPAAIQNKLIKNICGYEMEANGKTTFKEEFVTAGGITLSEIDPNTMMSRLVPNLYFAGEIMDVDGITGGFNFQNAWTTGFIAAKAISSQK
jgi:predicted Rossmann fold flavoprotein